MKASLYHHHHVVPHVVANNRVRHSLKTCPVLMTVPFWNEVPSHDISHSLMIMRHFWMLSHVPGS